MQLRIMLTTLVTTLLIATACASESAPSDTRETDRLSRQVQKLQEENATIRNELATLTAAGSEQQQTTALGIPVAPNAKPSRPTNNICSRSPAVQKLLLEQLKFPMCSVATGEELFRIEGMNFRGDLWAGDLDDLVNLKSLSVEILEGSLSQNIFADLVNLEGLHIDIETDNDEPWSLDGLLTSNTKLRGLSIDPSSEMPITLTKEALAGLQELEGIHIEEIRFLDDDIFPGLESLKRVELVGAFSEEQIEAREFVFPANMIRDNPGVESWDLKNFAFPEVIPFASLEQFCQVSKSHDARLTGQKIEYQFNGEKIVQVSKDNGVCRVGTGEPNFSGGYPESQIKIIDGRPEATP